MKAIALLFLATVLSVIAGCTTVRASFPGHDPSHVMTTMLAVARTPSYEDPDPSKRWFVKENQVWVDSATNRIEIYREVRRVLHRPGAKPVREDWTWKFQIVLDPEEPPTAVFVSRGFGLPTRAAAEGRRFFADVTALLGGDRPAGEPGDPAHDRLPPPDTPPTQDEPVIDIESLEPDG